MAKVAVILEVDLQEAESEASRMVDAYGLTVTSVGEPSDREAEGTEIILAGGQSAAELCVATEIGDTAENLDTYLS